jgi:hypothetical protein
MIMYVYHRTDAAQAILAEGFRDGTTHPMNALLWPGVWVSTFPLDMNEGAKGDAVLRVDIPDKLFTDHAFVPEGEGLRTYREALIPAELVNAYGPPTLLTEEELDELEANDPRFNHPDDPPTEWDLDTDQTAGLDGTGEIER